MLMEREAALDALSGYADEARRGQGRLVLVGGEAGVGKSALVERFATGLAEARTWWSGCDGLSTPGPLGPLFDLAGQLGGELLALCRARASREELFAALLHRIDEPGVLHVVVVEDVHWADEATVDLLRFLGRRVRTAAVLVIATYRDDALPPAHPLRLALGELTSHRSTRRLSLEPLSDKAVAVLAAGSGVPAARLYRLTGGNPFYVTEVLAAGLVEVPPSARDAVLARGARLGTAAREVLDVAALTGTRVRPALLGAVTGCPAPVLDELVDSGLLVGDGDWLRFRHEIARLAVAASVPAYRAAPLHARILAALRGAGTDDDALLAYHADAAGDGPAALGYARAAALRASGLGAHCEAAAQYERALRHVGDADPVAVARLCDALAYELSLVDQWTAAAATGERALVLWREIGDPIGEGATLRRLSRTMRRLCRGAEALALAQAALDVLEPRGGSVELAWGYANLAAQHVVDGRNDRALGLARRAGELARRLGEPAIVSDALNTEGCAIMASGGDWYGTLTRALSIATGADLPEQACRAYTNLATSLAGTGRVVEARRVLTEALAYCEDRDISTYATCMHGELAGVLARLGRWEEAEAEAGEALDRAAPDSINRITSLLSLGLIRARRDDAGAWVLLDDVLASSIGTGEPSRIIASRLARAEAWWLRGALDEARREAEGADDLRAETDPWTRGEVAIWLRRTGSARPARGTVAEPYHLELAGDPARAAQRWTDLGLPYEAALARLGAGQEAPLREALESFEKLGAVATVRVARRYLRQLGVRSIPTGARTATRAHPLGLTRRERDVLHLVCVGHTNAEIAARLFISAKTVDHHVSAVLAKLGVPTRTRAAAEAVRLGLVDTAGI